MKKSRLLEIIREEISLALNEAPTYDVNDMEGFKSTLKDMVTLLFLKCYALIIVHFYKKLVS